MKKKYTVAFYILIAILQSLQTVSASSPFDYLPDEPDFDNPACRFPIRWPFNDTKLAFQDTLPSEYFPRLKSLYETLNHDGILDHLKTTLQNLEDLPTEFLIPGAISYILAQPQQDILNLCDNFEVPYAHPYILWLASQISLDLDLFWKEMRHLFNPENEPKCRVDFFDAFETGYKLGHVWIKIGWDNLYRLGNLLYLVEKGERDCFKAVFGVYSSFVMIVNSEYLKYSILPEIAEWVLNQEIGLMQEWLEIGTEEITKFLNYVDKKQYTRVERITDYFKF